MISPARLAGDPMSTVLVSEVGLLGRRVVQAWILLGILVLGELFVVPQIPAALIGGAVPLNPLGWFGYGELAEVTVERRSFPLAYWLIVLTLTALAALFGVFIYAVLFRSAT